MPRARRRRVLRCVCGSAGPDSPSSDTGVGDIVEPLARVFSKTAPEHVSGPPRGFGRERLRRLLVDDCSEDVGDAVSVEGLLSRQSFVEYAAEGPDVGALVDGLSPRLLGAHVRSRSQDHPRLRRVSGERRRVREVGGRSFLGESFGQTEVEDLDLAVGRDFDVRRLEVAVDDSGTMRRFERFRNLSEEGKRFRESERPLRKKLGERLPGHELHHQKMGPRVVLEPVGGRDAGVVERRENSRFPLEASEPFRIAGEGIR